MLCAMITKPMTIRLNEEEKKDAARKAEAYGLSSIASLLRFALKNLKTPKNV